MGADHGGVILKDQLKDHLLKKGYEVVDVGTNGSLSVDYPDYAFVASEMVSKKEADRGVLICSTGIGMSIAANKVKGIRCALTHDTTSARLTREHNNSNVIAMGAKIVDFEKAKEILDIWLTTEFTFGRHERRVDKITKYEEERK